MHTLLVSERDDLRLPLDLSSVFLFVPELDVACSTVAGIVVENYNRNHQNIKFISHHILRPVLLLFTNVPS